MCFDMRFGAHSAFAYENNFKIITSSLGILRWKNMEQINDSRGCFASNYPATNTKSHY